MLLHLILFYYKIEDLMATRLRVMIIGDIVGDPGMKVFQRFVPELKTNRSLDAVIVNGENAAKDGRGLSVKIVDTLRSHGADIVTTGNHVWDNKEFYSALNERTDVIRPANYPGGCPGKGYAIFNIGSKSVAVINLFGRFGVNDSLDCPFRAAESLVLMLRERTKIIFVDFHGEATSEKRAMGMFLDGKVSGVYGTHTHIQTADEMIMPKGTSYLTDLGSCGALNSVIGFQFETIIPRFLYHHRASKMLVEDRGPLVLSGVIVDVDSESGKALSIERIRLIDDNNNI